MIDISPAGGYWLMHECKLTKCSLGLHMEQAEEINLDVCGDVLTCACV